MTSLTPFPAPGVTALGLAASRAVESTTGDRLIDDPFARLLFEAADAGLPMRLRWPAPEEQPSDAEALHLHGSRYIGVRTRFYDDALLRAVAGGVGQAVLLGAGLDTRGLRLSLPEALPLYELDQPEVLDYKRRTLQAHGVRPRASTRLVGADLAGADWSDRLDEAGLRPQQPTLWIAEGLLAYLDGPAQLSLLDAIDERSCAGSRVAFDEVSGGDVADLTRRSGIDMESLLVSVDGTDAAARRLADRGWSVTTTSADAVAAGYRRDLGDPFAHQGRAPERAPWLQTSFALADR